MVKKINCIKKGKRGELEIAHLLTKVTGVTWKRVPCSGALFTSQGSEQFKGDVYTDDYDFKDIVVEVKNTNGAVTINDFFNEKSKFNKWHKQTEEERDGKPGILFFKSSGSWFFKLYLDADTSSAFTQLLDSFATPAYVLAWKVNK